MLLHGLYVQMFAFLRGFPRKLRILQGPSWTPHNALTMKPSLIFQAWLSCLFLVLLVLCVSQQEMASIFIKSGKKTSTFLDFAS